MAQLRSAKLQFSISAEKKASTQLVLRIFRYSKTVWYNVHTLRFGKAHWNERIKYRPYNKEGIQNLFIYVQQLFPNLFIYI